MAPSQFRGEPPCCLLCGRDGQPTMSPEQAMALKKLERSGLGHRYRREIDMYDEPLRRRGRPPGVKTS